LQVHSEATHGQTDSTTRFSASNRSMMRYPRVSQVVRCVTEVGTTVPWYFENVKMEDISDCRATVGRRMVKRML